MTNGGYKDQTEGLRKELIEQYKKNFELIEEVKMKDEIIKIHKNYIEALEKNSDSFIDRLKSIVEDL